MKTNKINEYLGTLQQSVLTSWRKHLKSKNHAEHVILNDFYDDMLDAIDELVEGYQAHNEVVKDYVNLLDKTKEWTPIKYIQALYNFTKENREVVGDSTEIQGCVDGILDVCNSALYKLKHLVKENKIMDLKDLLNESLLNESSAFNIDDDYAIYATWDLVDMISKNNANKIKRFSSEDFDNYSISVDEENLNNFQKMFSWFAGLIDYASTMDLGGNWDSDEGSFQEFADLDEDSHGLVLFGDGDDGNYSVFVFKKPLSSKDEKLMDEFISYFQNADNMIISELF